MVGIAKSVPASFCMPAAEDAENQEQSRQHYLPTPTDMLLKILLVIDDYVTSNNGTTISCRRFATELRRQGHEVKVLGIGDPNDPDICCLPPYHLPVFDRLVRANDFVFAGIDMQTIRKAVEWADIVHCMMPFKLTYTTIQAANALQTPVTAGFHIQPENLLSAVHLGKCALANRLLYALWRKVIYDQTRHIHVPSRFMREQLLAHGYKGDIRAISNGISDLFKWQPKYKTHASEGKIIITMIGRLSREKRQDLLIKAASYSKYSSKIQLVFAGKGPLEQHYRETGKQLPKPPLFLFLSPEGLLDILAQTDLYVHASDMESEAIACIEAFATGLVPVISDSALSATSQFALDGRSLFRAGDAKDLARKMDYWIEHPQEKHEMEHAYAQKGLEYALETSVRQCVQMFEDAIREQ